MGVLSQQPLHHPHPHSLLRRHPGLFRTMMHVLLFALMAWPQVAEALVYTIPEEQPPGSHIGNLAEDTDLEQYVSSDSINNLRYSFLAGETSYTSLFRLDEATGDLSIARTGRVDREEVCRYAKQCVLPLKVAIQSTLNQFFRKVSLDINVTDINDNAPTFPDKSAEVVISESVGIPSTFPLMSAVDLDMGVDNGLKGYELIPAGGPFGLSFTPGSPNLLLVVQRPDLDHERQESYQVQVIARDGGSPPRQGTLLVNITVSDENDNKPVFTEPSYAVTVDEDVAKGYVLIAVTATDRDSGDNGRVRYRLSPQQSQTVLSMFHVNPATGELTVAGDIENGEQESYNITVEATDMGAQPFTTSTIVTVTVRDTINSPPRMTVSLLAGGNGYSIISEYASIGAVVAHIAVKDGDRGRNGIVQCQIERHPYFELQGFDVNEYKVIVARSLDRETVAAHNVTVFCTDAGVRPLTASATFEVRILDENDNSPVFAQNVYHVYLPENSVSGMSLITVVATDADADENGKVRYSLQPSARGRFIINPETGEILLNDDFDYELETSFNFTVVATDQGKRPTSSLAEVMISVTDVNDQKPSFARDVFPFTVSEFATRGRVVGRVTANDFERGVNGEVVILPDRYSIRGIPFTVHPNGSIELTGSVDHEDVTYYYFKIIAVDKGRPPLNDTAEVQITVMDENDNRPRVTSPNGTDLHLYVSMDDDIAKPVTMIQAVDPDSGLNGQIQFIITSRNDSGRFDVDANSGEVFITRALTRTDVSMYRMQVLVQDSGTPPLPADRTITVWIHAGNGTRGSGVGQASDQYILITLAIVCITIILSAIIVLIIVVMRRMDRRRKAPSGGPMHIQNPRVSGSYSDRVKADNMHNETLDDGGLGEKEYGGGGFETFGKGICEEEEDFGFSSFKGGKQDGVYGGNSLSSDDFKNQPPTDSDMLPSAASHPVSVSQESDLDLEALQLHQVLLQSYHDSTAAAGESWQPVVRQEDGQSDSSGETIPSDSGRGGSEEDISHSSHVGAALNDDSRLAALHDASFQSTVSNTFPGAGSHAHLHLHPYHHNPSKSSKSSVRDPVRNSSRKHVTFKDLSAGKRGPRPGAPGTGSSLISPRSGTPGAQSPRGALGESSFDAEAEPPRYSQLPNRDSPRIALQGLPAGSGDSLNSPRGSLLQQQSPRDSPRSALDSPRCAPSGQDSPRSVPVYVNEPFGRGPGPATPSRDWSRSPALFNSDKPQPFARGPRSSFNSSQELQTFYPAPRPVSARPSRDHQQASPPGQRETPLDSRDPRHVRDWRNDSLATTDDCDDQRSTTTSGSYTIDNEDSYVGLDMNHAPWKDVVV